MNRGPWILVSWTWNRTFEFTRGGERGSPHRSWSGAGPLDIEPCLEEWIENVWAERDLCEIDETLGGTRPWAPTYRQLAYYHRMLKSRILRALETGALQVTEIVTRPELDPIAVTQTSPEELALAPEEAAPPRDRFLRLRLLGDSEPRARKSYILKLDNGSHLEGKTSADGLLVEKMPAQVQQVTVCIESLDLGFEEYVVNLDSLRQETGLNGVQQRLRNVGLLGVASGKLDEGTQAALARFQTRHQLKETGQLDQETNQKLKEVHGS